MSDNEGMRCVLAMQPVYERCREMVELADSNPNYRLAVVDTKITTSDRVLDENFELQRITYYRVVKMEGKETRELTRQRVKEITGGK